GYYPYEAVVQIKSQETTYVARLEAIPLDCDMEGTISGRVTDSTTNAPIEGAEIKFKKMSDGTIEDTQTTDANGFYKSKPLASGYYKLEVKAPGYSRVEVQNVPACGYDDGNPDNDDHVENVTLSPLDGNWRVVLQWGSSPKDLDLHVKLPDGNQVFYRNACRGDRDAPPYVELDVDVRDGYGPETVTLTSPAAGTYQFFVHNYGGQNDGDSGTLSNSGARIVVYDPEGAVVKTYNVPAGCGSYFWYAFNMVYDSNGRPTLQAENRCGSGTNPAEGEWQDASRCDLP
ncbi:MAG: hypothetical protein D6806_01065, partial [Deltaproteobacteria bacterium]